MNLLEKLFPVKPEVATDVMEVVEKSYPKVVQDIHREFLTAGDRLLATAQEILASIVISNEEKVNQLKTLGFVNAKEVAEMKAKQTKREEQERISIAITDLKKRFPNNKIITDDVVDKICSKYSLVFGFSSMYKGFIPQKNLNDIALFYKNHPEEGYLFFLKQPFDQFPKEITKAEYDDYLTDRLDPTWSSHYCNMQFSKILTPLNICAPLKDMDITGYEAKGGRLSKIIPPKVETPDPVVTIEKKHENGVVCHVILTAWGDEARDPEIINENLN